LRKQLYRVNSLQSGGDARSGGGNITSTDELLALDRKKKAESGLNKRIGRRGTIGGKRGGGGKKDRGSSFRRARAFCFSLCLVSIALTSLTFSVWIAAGGGKPGVQWGESKKTRGKKNAVKESQNLFVNLKFLWGYLKKHVSNAELPNRERGGHGRNLGTARNKGP